MKLPKFNNNALFEQALTHRSYLNEAKKTKLESNERLEFLGDAILSFITSLYLYSHFPQFEEGQLTNLRSNLVKTTTLGKIAADLEIGSLIKISKGEDVSGGRTNMSILADTYEAIVGALYLDQGIKPTEEFIQNTVFSLIPQILGKERLKDYKSLLQEVVQNKHHSSPQYMVENETGPDHSKTFLIGVFVQNERIGEGAGSSKQKAEQEAARTALANLNHNLLK